MKIILVILFLIALVDACNQGYFINTELETQFPEGRELFISKCNSCHQLYDPDKYDSTGWNSILVTMKVKAKINEDQSTEIYNWILEVRRNNKISVYQE